VAARQEVTNLPAYIPYPNELRVAFSPDGQILAYNENEAGDIALWDIPNRQLKSVRLTGHRWYVPSLAFTPDSRLLVSGSMDRTIRLWDVAEGRQVGAFTNYPVGVAGVRISPDGKTLAVAATMGWQQVILQDTLTGTILGQLRGHQNSLTDAGFATNGHTLITGSADGTVRVWEVAQQPRPNDRRAFETGLSQLTSGSGTAVFLSPDGRHLMSVFTDKTVSVWDVPTLTESRRHPLPLSKFSCGALAPGGLLAVFVARDGNIVFWHTDSGETNSFARMFTNDSTRAVFSPDGKRLAIGNVREVCVLDVESKTKLQAYRLPDWIGGEPSDIVMSLAFFPDGQRLIAGFYSGMVKVWDLSGATAEVTLDAHDHQVRGLAVLPDGQTLVSASREVRFWNLNSRRQVGEFKPRVTMFFGCSISPDGRRLAIGASDGLITIWDLASRQEVATLDKHTQRVDWVAFLSDGNTLASVGLDHVRIWRAASLAEADGEMRKK